MRVKIADPGGRCLLEREKRVHTASNCQQPKEERREKMKKMAELIPIHCMQRVDVKLSANQGAD